MQRRTWRAVFASLLSLAATAVLGQQLWWGELLSTFSPGFVVGLLLVARLGRGPGRYAAVGAGVGLAAYTLASTPPAADRGIESDLSIVFWNAAVANKTMDEGLAVLQEIDADIVVVAELDARWDATLAALGAAYTWRHLATRPGPDGLGVWSKYPLHGLREVHPVAGWARPAILAQVDHPAGRFNLVAVHPTAPLGAERQRRFDGVADALHGLEGPAVVVGDMNRAPWMFRLRRLALRERLRLASGLAPTWPRQTSPLGLPLDQVLVSPNIGVTSFERLGFAGSDHRPVVAILDLPEAR